MKKIKTRNWRLKKYKLLKWLWVGLFIIGGFYCSIYVDAGMNDSNIEKNRVDDIYAVANIDGISRIFYLNMYEMNERSAYCIDIGVDIKTSVYHSTNDFSVSRLTDEQIDYIRSISYFGYGYQGHNDYKYYMAAQELIWEYLGEIEVEWTNEMSADGTRIDIGIYKETILTLKDEYDKKIEFGNIDGRAFSVGEDNVLTDNNGVLFDYEVVSSKYSEVNIKGNDLVIKVGNVIGKEQIELKRKGYYDYESKLYYYDNSQRLISNGNYKDIDEVVSFDINGASLTGKVVQGSDVKSISVDASLEGAMYEIYDKDNNLIGTYKTDAEGKFRVDNLLLGEYSIKQIKESTGYVINKKLKNFVVDKDNQELVLEQRLILNSFELRKFYGSDGNYKPESLITFLVYDSNWDFRFYLTTDLDGIAFFRLPYGRYTIRQNNSTNGYAKVDDFIIEVTEDKQLTDITYYNLVDELVRVNLKINSYQQKSEEKILENGFKYQIKIRGTDDYFENDGKNVFDADENGNLIMSKGVPFGNYVIEQVSTPEGVLLNETGINFNLNDNTKFSLVNGNLVMELNIYNELIMGRVNVLATQEKFFKEVNEYGYKVLKRIDSEFRLTVKEDIVVNGKVLYKSGDEIYKGITDKDGKLIIDNLYLGSYCLIDDETFEEKCFELKSNDNKTKTVEVSMEFIKKLDKGNVMVQNFSSNGNAISESLFEIVDDENLVIYNGMSNNEGIIKVENLLLGNYCLRQKQVSSKYSLNKEKKCFSLDGDKAIEFINEEVVEKVISVPNTWSESIGLYEAVVVLVMIGTGIFVYKRIFKSKLYR